MHHYKAHEASATCVAFHPTGNYLLSTSHDNSIKLWDVREGQVLYTLQGHDGAVNCAEFSQDCKLLASGAVDSCVLVWEADLDKCLQIERPNPKVEATTVVEERRKSASKKAGNCDDEARAANMPMSSPPPTPTSTVPTPQQKPQHPYAASKYEVRPMSSTIRSPVSSDTATSVPPPPPAMSLETPKSPGRETRSPTSQNGTTMNGRYSMDNTLQHIVGQLEIITRTLSVLEKRISINEDRICEVARVQKEILERQKQTARRGES
ncbi:hypothetical protein PC119_g18449 [Phytophthora cactorum]|nr:hypothetical protein PC119_g18449 [Phytophthora cactorum]